MREQAHLFGEGKSLVGIVTEPVAEKASDRPGVLLVNAGLIHRVGPNRMYVELARTLAGQGFTALRFDLSGLGDSAPRSDGMPIDARAVVEAGQAMDSLGGARKLKRFISIGLCSGADDSVRIALADPRVTGVVLIDSFYQASSGFIVRSYLPKLLRLDSWVKLFTGRSELWGGVLRALRRKFGSGADAPSRDWNTIGADELLTGLASLVDRGVNVLLVYTGRGAACYQYRTRFKPTIDRLAREGSLRVEIFDDSDHVFSRRADRRELARVVCDWALRLRPSGVSSARVSAG